MMGNGVGVSDPERRTLRYEQFQDVRLVVKEVWKRIFLRRAVSAGSIRTNVQDRLW